MSVLALVPARGGSKGVPRKNVADLGGHPLLAWSVRTGLAADSVDRVIVTTDDEELAELGRSYGAEAPFLRPPEISGDDAVDLDYVRHALDFLDEEPELVVQLRPTTPLRDPERIDAAVEALRADSAATGLRSVHEMQEPPQKMLGVEDGYLTGLFPQDERPEYFNLPRQEFPPAYWPNGYVDAIRPATVRGSGALYGERVIGFITETIVEIDGPGELEYARWQLQREGRELPGG